MPEATTSNTVVFTPPGIDFERIFSAIYTSLSGGESGSLLDRLETIWNIYSVLAILLSLVFFVGFVYAKIRYGQLVEIEQAALKEAEAQWAARHSKTDSKNVKWDAIQRRVTENNPESWRIAIIEADIMLEEVLNNAGYVGQSIGDKLKSANPNSFTTVQDAWEAHKVRNTIAHVGSDFVLTQKVAQETITQFGRVFREFGVV